MTGPPASDPERARAAFPRTASGVASVLAALVVGALGWSLAAVSDRAADRVPGWLLLGVALFGAAAGAVVLTGRGARQVALAASAAFVLGGVAAALLLLVDGGAFVSDVLLLGGVPVACGVVTGLLALHGRSSPG